MQLQQLIYFMTVAEQGSFNKAAEKLFATQPNLSKAISNLESELKVNIFYRTNRGVELTEDGKKLYQYSRTIRNQMELIEGLAAKEVPRVLSVASYPIVTISRLISEFYNSHREEPISLKLSEERMYRVIEMVESGEADIGFVMSNQVQMKELRHVINFKGIELHVLGMDTWYANLGPAHPLYDREEVTIQELLQYPFVRRPDDYFSNLTHYLEIDGVRLTNFTQVVYLNDTSAILSLLRSTDAFRFGPGLSAGDFAAYDIRTIPIRNCKIQITSGWLKKKRGTLSREAEDFVSMLQKLYPLSL
ncbi:MAG: LysR family transcriptional regulator [Dysosmobacter sp.]|nr:LysR family transcriptional regulator [Dysosmobacter sp.]